MTEITNEDRAEFARTALEAFAEACGIQRRGNGKLDEDTQTLLVDLLCDLRHLCDWEGLRFDAEAERSREHYDYEIYWEENADCECRASV